MTAETRDNLSTTSDSTSEQPDDELQVSTLQLFFDIVFVFRFVSFTVAGAACLIVAIGGPYAS